MKHRPLITLLAGLLLLAGCADQSPPQVTRPTATHAGGLPASDPFTLLEQQPLHLPTLAAGAACPVAQARQVSPDFGIAIGEGPIYAAGFDTRAMVNYAHTNQEGGWFAFKVLWFGDPSYNGPVLIRGHQLDGPNDLGFDQGEVSANPPKHLEFPVGSGGSNPDGWNSWPTYTRVRAPGCYAYQVDGTNFSEVLVFQAINQP